MSILFFALSILFIYSFIFSTDNRYFEDTVPRNTVAAVNPVEDIFVALWMS